jgi:hypothetical protein
MKPRNIYVLDSLRNVSSYNTIIKTLGGYLKHMANIRVPSDEEVVETEYFLPSVSINYLNAL